LELPEREDFTYPVYQKYRVFTDEAIRDLNRRLMEHIRSISSAIAIDGYDFQRIESNTELGRPLPVWQYSASSNTRNCHDFEGKIRPSNTSVDFLGFPCRHTAVSPWLQELRLWQNLANRGGLDYYLIGRLDNHWDKCGFENIRKVFHFTASCHEELRSLKSEAKVLVFHKALWDDDAEVRGWVRLLCESHIPLDERQLGKLTKPEQLKPYRLVILPDLRYISDDQVSLLDGFVKEGGIILATGETALYNDKYEPRHAMPLASMGIERILYHRKDMISALFLVDTLEDKKAFPHFADTGCIASGSEFFFTQVYPKTKPYLRLLPPQRFGPPERCYPVIRSNIPAFTTFPYHTH
jgi:hypothetical protein